ncbi:type IV pilus twitching motility protein PilT [Methylocella tundrae]|uniref:Bacterial type II secretion system protein E domain-containing protein n=1 Tax=Methylocella tundrae TaxID=227605 RepID=A0A4V6YUL2_METTU|nr:ATPase, T2SS/T4P/T4SS family [Methylocella tundrae]WPP02809.1 ATPase, T2SS/T4P/T4SS family [Methylocella tundrae]VFU17609.1 conserved protein of unknown function [Methylocella tundrae]
MLDHPESGAARAGAADRYAWPDEGLAWVTEPRRHAPGLDSFMSHVHRLGAEQIMFTTWQPASFRLYGENHKISRPPLDEKEAALIVNHLYGADGMARLQGGKDLNVMYVIGVSRTTTLRFRVNVSGTVTSRGDGANVTIRPVKDLPPPLEKQNVEAGILSSFQMKKGLMIVSGATGSGKSTLIGGMTLAKLVDPASHRNIIEFAEPIEFLFDRVKSPTSAINQSEIPRNIQSFDLALAGAMRRQPTDIIVGECRKPEHMQAVIHAAISGHAAATTLHAENVALTMQRVASLLPAEQFKEAMISCAQSLRLVINQRLVKRPDGKWTPLREFLVFEKKFRDKLASAAADDWPHLTMEALERDGQSYEKAIAIALEEGRIDEETAADVRRELE